MAQGTDWCRRRSARPRGCPRGTVGGPWLHRSHDRSARSLPRAPRPAPRARADLGRGGTAGSGTRGGAAADRRRAGHGQDHAAARRGRAAAWPRGRTRRARWCWSGAVARQRSCASGWCAWARATAEQAARRWSARSTPTRSACSACTPRGTAIRRRGCSRAPSRMRWSATCWAVRSTASSPARGGPSGSSPRWRCRGSPPSCASCCCAPPSGGWVPTSWPSWARGTTSPNGRRRAGSSAATSRSPCCGAPRAGERRRPRRPRSTPPSWWRPRSTRSRRTPSCSPPSGERVRHLRRRRRAGPRSAADGAGRRARAQRGHRAARGRPRPGRPHVPRRRSGGHAGRSRRETVVLTVDHRGAPAVRAAGCRGSRARLPGAGEGRHRPAGRAGPAAAGGAGAGRRPGGRAGVHLRRPGGGLDRRPAAPRPPHRRRAVVADGGARALGAARAARRCGARSWPRASRSPRLPTSCRWPANPRSCRC